MPGHRPAKATRLVGHNCGNTGSALGWATPPLTTDADIFAEPAKPTPRDSRRARTALLGYSSSMGTKRVAIVDDDAKPPSRTGSLRARVIRVRQPRPHGECPRRSQAAIIDSPPGTTSCARGFSAWPRDDFGLLTRAVHMPVTYAQRPKRTWPDPYHPWHCRAKTPMMRSRRTRRAGCRRRSFGPNAWGG